MKITIFFTPLSLAAFALAAFEAQPLGKRQGVWRSLIADRIQN
jgi:hypothetical protein